jgi:formylglycine-generating enzyme required for sulfatase activity
MKRNFALLLLLSANSLSGLRSAMAVTIATVPVGNPGNAPDVLYAYGPFGSVGYEYRIGNYEVTNDQYAGFLNAKATADLLGLYSIDMGSIEQRGGIARSGSDGSYSYSTISGRGDMPVNNVNWYQAVRFANWLNNGQGNGDTETGSYTLLGGTPEPSNGASISRNLGAKVFLPSEDEWYKAAYYNPASNTYSQYPTGSDAVPTAEVPPGGDNSANYESVVNADLTKVGAYTTSHSSYGAFDMGGNVYEWNESYYPGGVFPNGPDRGLRGGWYGGFEFEMRASTVTMQVPLYGSFYNGFRIATIPEPSTAVLLVIGCIAWRAVTRQTTGRAHLSHCILGTVA